MNRTTNTQLPETSESDGAITLSGLQFAYEDQSAVVLDIAGMSVPTGQLVSFLGASGCGKSTLLRLVAGLLHPTEGQISCASASSAVSPGMVFQSPTLVPWRTARDNVLLPSELGQRKSKISDEDLDRLFHMVGFDVADTFKRPGELSGGMQMRVSIARALVLEPRLLLLDEPFAALDDLLRMQLEQDLRRIHVERGLTTLLVTHNINEAVFMSDRVVVLGGQPSSIAADLTIELADRDSSLRSTTAFHDHVNEVTLALYSANGMKPDDLSGRGV